MRGLINLVIFVVIVLVAVGFWRSWFAVKTTERPSDGKMDVHVEVDKNRIRGDLKDAGQAVRKATRRAGERAEDVAEDVREGGEEIGREVREAGREIGRDVRETEGDLRENTREMRDDFRGSDDFRAPEERPRRSSRDRSTTDDLDNARPIK